MNEFENLKVGDKVIVSIGCWGEEINNVTKVTDKQIVVKGNRFWKKNGRQVGDFNRLKLVTEERIKQIEDRKKARKLCAFLNMTHWENLSLESLINIADCVKKEIGDSATKQ